MWQLSRSSEKLEIEQSLSNREHSQPLPLAELNIAKESYLTGLIVTAHLSPVIDKYLLLDNQTFQGQIGYLAYQLMMSQQGELLLLERGFIKATSRRERLLQVDWLTQPIEIKGRLYQRSINPLSDQLLAESGELMRVQNLNITQLAHKWQLQLEPYVIQPQMESWPYPQPWKPVPLSSSKHMGYAVQWFSMAAVLILLSVWAVIRSIKKGGLHE